MAHGVDTAVQPVKPPGAEPMLDPGRTDSTGLQLPSGDDAVLLGSESGDEVIHEPSPNGPPARMRGTFPS